MEQLKFEDNPFSTTKTCASRAFDSSNCKGSDPAEFPGAETPTGAAFARFSSSSKMTKRIGSSLISNLLPGNRKKSTSLENDHPAQVTRFTRPGNLVYLTPVLKNVW